jgi:hypothetical protein
MEFTQVERGAEFKKKMCRSTEDNKIDGKINGKSSRQQKYRS